MCPLRAAPAGAARRALGLLALGLRLAAAQEGEEVQSDPPPSLFIEDQIRASAKPKFHMLLGSSPGEDGSPRLLSLDAEKAPWHETTFLDFARLGPGLGRAAKELEESARIYVHQVPECAGERLLRFVAEGAHNEDGEQFGWGLALQLHAAHAAAVHQAILSSSAVTDDAGNATMFYIPAFFGLLVERYIDTQDPRYLNCLAETWHALPEELFLRNGGYDHFIVAGTCHPYSICSTMECDITTYHPFAGNVAVLVGGTRELGHVDHVFEPAEMWRLLRFVPVPFPVELDCARLGELAAPSAERPIAVAFVGSENSLVRRIFREMIEDARWPYGSDPRVKILVLPEDGDADGEAARRAALGGPGGAGGKTTASALYETAEFCLVLPGHIYDLGRRGYDVMARGCIPVIVAVEPMYVAVPFPWQLPWHDIAVFSNVNSVEDAASIVGSLLSATESSAGRARIAARRAALVQHAPALFLPPHRHCPEGAPSATDGILRELAIRQAALAPLGAQRPRGWPRRGEAQV